MKNVSLTQVILGYMLYTRYVLEVDILSIFNLYWNYFLLDAVGIAWEFSQVLLWICLQPHIMLQSVFYVNLLYRNTGTFVISSMLHVWLDQYSCNQDTNMSVWH